jgi:hypothetical protein
MCGWVMTIGVSNLLHFLNIEGNMETLLRPLH